MMDKLTVKGFKRFEDQSFDLAPLTLLAGLNGTGKSSFIQSLLLIREAGRKKDAIVELNGPFGLELGTFLDVVNSSVGDSFSIHAQAGKATGRWQFTGAESDRYTTVKTTRRSDKVFIEQPRSFQYLSAERIGPRIAQAAAPLPATVLEVGCRGEFCAQIVDQLGGMSVSDLRISGRDEAIPKLLKAQTEHWLSRVTRPVQIDTEWFPDAAVLALKFRTAEEWVKPTNMGFGVSFALPIIVAGLAACEGSMLIVENPEAHLHPAGQSQMGVFLASMAAAGLQVIVETHSDHILNGVRRAIGEAGTLKASDAIAYHFSPAKSVEPIKVSFNSSGTLSSWPDQFFDQFQEDVAALTRVRRRR